MIPAPGFLAIWSDIAAEHETEYLHWLTREHTAERVGVPGFRGVRVFRAVPESPRRYFILYELDAPTVVDSAAYLERLNAPTPWSSRTMPRLGGFRRGGGSLGRSCGLGGGGVLAVATVDSAARIAAISTALPGLAAMDRVCAARTLLVDQDRTGVATREKSLRGGDDVFAGLLLVEGLDVPAVAAALDVADLEGGIYNQVFHLGREALTGKEEDP